LDAWIGLSPGQSLEAVFDVPDSLGLDGMSLQSALSFGGGPDLEGAARILLRSAVAALLNAAQPGVDYPLTEAQIISQVDLALASGDRSTIIDLAATLDALNNLGCPF
jgi:hypothetical protein